MEVATDEKELGGTSPAGLARSETGKILPEEKAGATDRYAGGRSGTVSKKGQRHQEFQRLLALKSVTRKTVRSHRKRNTLGRRRTSAKKRTGRDQGAVNRDDFFCGGAGRHHVTTVGGVP